MTLVEEIKKMTFLSRSSALSFSDLEGAQLYLIDLKNIREAEVTHAKLFLDKKTLDRTSRCIFPEERKKRVVVYAFLRFHLEGLVGQKASEIDLLRNSYGKPYLKGLPVHFSLSHTRQYAALALHPHYSIGVDIEAIRNIPNVLELAALFMHHKEQVQMLNSDDKIDYFFSLWCSKEAFLKAKEIRFDQLPNWNLDLHYSLDSYRWLASKYNVYLCGKTIGSHKIAVCIHKKRPSPLEKRIL